MEDEIDLREYINVLLKRWRVIALFAICFAAAAFIYSLRQSPVYEAKATILLRTGNSGGSSLTQYTGLAGLMGINIAGSGGNLGDLVELLKSRAVAAKVLSDLNLTQRIKGWDDPKIKKEDLASTVSRMLKSPKITGNIIEIKAEADNPQLAADIANEFIFAISFYWNELNFTEAQKKLKYIQSELPRVESDLKLVEAKLKLVPRSSNGFSFGSSVGVGGLQRDYEIYNSVYTMLKKELESTKLDASKEIPPFSMVDSALKPDLPTKPKIKLNTMIALVLGAFIGVFIAFFQEYWEKSRKS
jgi:uncharacterized protein involved in exopolysaccharide biosynthesis